MQHWIHKRKPTPAGRATLRARPFAARGAAALRSRYRDTLRRLAAGALLSVCLALHPAAALAELRLPEQRLPEQRLPERPLPERTLGEVASGSLLLRPPGQSADAYREAPRLATDLELTVVGSLARTQVRQTFVNPTADWVEAVYVFPLPDDAAVDHLQMRVGERRIVGEIREREAARREYEAARAAGRKAALLSQERSNLFTTAVSNIAPGETVTIEIEYQQSVQRHADTFRLRIPLTLTPRYIPGTPQAVAADRAGSGWSLPTDVVDDADRVTPQMLAAAGVTDHRLRLQASIDAGRPLASLVSRYHPIAVTSAGGDRFEVTLRDGDVSLDHDLALEWTLAPRTAPDIAAFAAQGDDARYVLAEVLPPTTPAAAPPPRELIIVLDTSGSMQGVSLAQAQAAVQVALSALRDVDHFNVIAFSNVPVPLYPVAQPATAGNRRHAIEWVERRAADGGTEMRLALQAALANESGSGALRQILFVTDGAVGNEEALFRQLEADLGRNRLFTVGIGSAPNGWFMRKAAEIGRGSTTTISAVGEVAERMREILDMLARPVLTDVQVDWQGARAEQFPAVIADLYHGEPVAFAARLPGSTQPQSVTISGTLWRDGEALPWRHEIDVDAALREQADAVGVLWARRKIEALADARRRGADAGETRRQIVEVALAHHIVSEATSLVAIDQTPERSAEAALKRRNVANLMPYGSGQALAGLVATATPAALQRATGAALLALFLALLLGSRVRGVRRTWL